MKPLTIVLLGLLTYPACNAKSSLTQEEIHSQILSNDGESIVPLVTHIQTADPVERKRLLAMVVVVAKEEVKGVKLPFTDDRIADPEAKRSLRAVRNASYILGEVGDEKAILEAFSETFRTIEPETRASSIAFTLSKCYDPIALNLIEESAMDSMETLLGFDLNSLNDDQGFVANLSAASLIWYFEAMAISVNPAGEPKARAILDDLKARSAGRPRFDQLIEQLEEELEGRLGRALAPAGTSKPDEGDLVHGGSSHEVGKRIKPPGEMLKPRYFAYSFFGITILAVVLLILKARNHRR